MTRARARLVILGGYACIVVAAWPLDAARFLIVVVACCLVAGAAASYVVADPPQEPR